jgi:ABC-type nitrate/sulfonate/bicarbonate transport system substrate-binding protein
MFGGQPGMAQTKVSILHAVIGPKQAALWVGQEQGIFAKHGVDVQVLRFNPQRPARDQLVGDVFGAVGIPVAIGWAAEGTELKVVVAFNNASATTMHLLSRPGVKTPAELRGTRFGINRVGTGSWISAMQALDHFGLKPIRDGITLVEGKDGGLGVARALENGEVDAAAVDPAQSTLLRAKGFLLLLDMSATDLPGIQDGVAVAGSYLREHPDVVEKVVIGMAEAIAYSLSPQNKAIVTKTIMARLNISSPEAAEVAYQEFLKRVSANPRVSVTAAQSYQRVLAFNDPRVLNVRIEDILEDRFVQGLEQSGAVARFSNAYGVR